MPTTPIKALPYPVTTDTPDVPRDVLALATRVETLLSAAETIPNPTDLNALKVSGVWQGPGNWITNEPDPAYSGSWLIEVTGIAGTDYVRQRMTKFTDPDPKAVYERFITAGTWGSWAMLTRASGTSTTPVGGSVGVTFPAGLFATAPKVTLGISTGAMPSSVVGAYAASVAAAGFTLRVNSGASPTGGAGTVDWHAFM